MTCRQAALALRGAGRIAGRAGDGPNGKRGGSTFRAGSPRSGAAPDETAEALERVPHWGDLIRTGRVEGPWHEVEWPPPAPGEAPFARLDSRQFPVKSGARHGGPASFYCVDHAPRGRAAQRSWSGKGIELDGRGWLVVDNGAADDAYVKLIGESGEVALSVYVAARQTALVESIPVGSYEIAFATGSHFSRGCDSFSRRAVGPQVLPSGSSTTGAPQGWTIGLGRAGSSEHAHTNSNDLRRVRDGCSAVSPAPAPESRPMTAAGTEDGLAITLGVEEEFFLVDPETRDLLADPDEGIFAACDRGTAGRTRSCTSSCARRSKPTRGCAARWPRCTSHCARPGGSSSRRRRQHGAQG